MDLLKNQFRYKAWANVEMLDALAQLDAGQHPEAWKSAIRLMNHAYVVDRIFAAHLDGATHAFQATNTPETPGLDALREAIAVSDDWYQQYVGALDGEALRSPIDFTFTDGDRGRMTREEMLFHILAHGAYHRGNVGMVLSSCGLERPRDTFTRFLHLVDDSRRG